MPYDKDSDSSEALGNYRCYGLREGHIRWVEEIAAAPLRHAIEIGRQVATEREAESFEIWEGKAQLHVEPMTHS